MGIFKVFITLFFLGWLISCKPQTAEKNETVEHKTEVSVKTAIPIEGLKKKEVLGKFDYTKDSNFVKVPNAFSSKTIYIRKQVLKAFLAMQEEAKKDGINFKIISGTRNFAHQKRIWNYKYNTKFKHIKDPKARMQKILEYSSMPTTSRHHWGTDIDLNSLNNNYFKTGKGKKEYDWLVKNANKFGFYQVYTSKENGRTGYNEEKWHWSYAPLSSKYLAFYNKHISYKDISGFKGSENAKQLNTIKEFVNGINLELLGYE